MALSVYWEKIDIPGAIVGGVIASCIYAGGGYGSLALLFLFFVMGSLASHWKISWKQAEGLAEKNKGKRSVVNAVSNGGVAAICGLLAALFASYSDVFLCMLAASLASATADTLASELGNIYGKYYINILTLKSDERGKDGVISLAGTLWGALGSLVIAVSYGLANSFDTFLFIVFIGGIMGNAFDSILGASLQQKGYLNNHMVNVANTAFAALVAGGISLFHF